MVGVDKQERRYRFLQFLVLFYGVSYSLLQVLHPLPQPIQDAKAPHLHQLWLLLVPLLLEQALPSCNLARPYPHSICHCGNSTNQSSA